MSSARAKRVNWDQLTPAQQAQVRLLFIAGDPASYSYELTRDDLVLSRRPAIGSERGAMTWSITPRKPKAER